MLLALSSEEGTVATAHEQCAVAGAVLAELLLDRRISVEDTPEQLVELLNMQPTGDPIIDECMEKMHAARSQESLSTWVAQLAGIEDLQHRVARQLCHRGILRADKEKVLLVFRQEVYPVVDPVPEKRIVERLRAAIFTDSVRLDPRTVVLVSLANSVNLLSNLFGREEVMARRTRIERIIDGELISQAAEEVIAACDQAVVVSAQLPMIMANISTSA